ncbi:hypothetical protein ACWD6R_33670 [Streptomyces sp. NPDC005151]
MDFYYDLSQAFPDGSALAGKRIIISSRSTTAPAGGEGVFFDRDAPQGGSLPPLPDALSDRLHFVHEGIAWSGKGRKRRVQGRKWLRTANLVHDYGADRVLEIVASALSADGMDDDVRIACLRYACAVSHALETGGRRAPVLKNLRVPTRAGWFDASRAMFGPGWPGEHSSVDDTLTRFLEHVRGLSSVLTETEGRLLLGPEGLCGDVILVEAMRRFLERHRGRRTTQGGKQTRAVQTFEIDPCPRRGERPRDETRPRLGTGQGSCRRHGPERGVRRRLQPCADIRRRCCGGMSVRRGQRLQR